MFPYDFIINETDLDGNDNHVYLEKIKDGSFEDKTHIDHLYCGAKVTVCAENVKCEPLHGEFTDDNNASQHVLQLNCPKCRRTVGVRLKNRWWTVDDVLKTSDSKLSGFIKVTTFGGRLVQWTLSRVLYRQYEQDLSDPTFLPAPPGEHAKIIWKDGRTVGFYTHKPKGHQYSTGISDCYELPMVDTIFIRKSQRGKGYGAAVIKDMVKDVGRTDIGFSLPISQGFLAVLKKFLHCNREYRDHFWECSYVGSDGHRLNIWLRVKKMQFPEEVSRNLATASAVQDPGEVDKGQKCAADDDDVCIARCVEHTESVDASQCHDITELADASECHDKTNVQEKASDEKIVDFSDADEQRDSNVCTKRSEISDCPLSTSVKSLKEIDADFTGRQNENVSNSCCSGFYQCEQENTCGGNVADTARMKESSSSTLQNSSIDIAGCKESSNKEVTPEKCSDKKEFLNNFISSCDNKIEVKVNKEKKYFPSKDRTEEKLHISEEKNLCKMTEADFMNKCCGKRKDMFNEEVLKIKAKKC